MDRKINAELAFAFSQLFEEDLMKVPDEIKETVLNNFDEKVFNSFDSDKPFTDQELSEETLEILAEIFRNEE